MQTKATKKHERMYAKMFAKIWKQCARIARIGLRQ